MGQTVVESNAEKRIYVVWYERENFIFCGMCIIICFCRNL